MEQKLEILEDDERLATVVKVKVPGIYGATKGNPLPKRMAKLVKPAAQALQRVYKDIVAEGGHLYISDMFRWHSNKKPMKTISPAAKALSAQLRAAVFMKHVGLLISTLSIH